MKFRNMAPLVLLVSCFCAEQAFAGQPEFEMVKGKFRFAATARCTESQGGFSPRPSLQPLGGLSVYQDAFTGTMQFDGRGGALQKFKGMTMFDLPLGPFNSAVGTFDGLCSFKYTMTSDLEFTLAGTCSGNLPDGPAAGQTFTTSGIQLEGQISRDGDTILLTGTTPAEQQIVLSGGYIANRYCTQSGTLIRGLSK